MRHGSVVDEDWRGSDRFAPERSRRHPVPLPPGVACHAIAGSLAAVNANGRGMRGDGIVTIASALGRHRDPRLDLALPPSNRWIAANTGHLALLSSVAVSERMVSVLARAGGALRR